MGNVSDAPKQKNNWPTKRKKNNWPTMSTVRLLEDFPSPADKKQQVDNAKVDNPNPDPDPDPILIPMVMVTVVVMMMMMIMIMMMTLGFTKYFYLTSKFAPKVFFGT